MSSRLFYFALIFICPFTLFSQSKQNYGEELSYANTSQRTEAFVFEENIGQITGTDADKVKFVYKLNGGSIFLMEDGLAYQFNNFKQSEAGNFDDEVELVDDMEQNASVETYRMNLKLVGASNNSTVTKHGKSNDFINYFTQNTLGVYGYSKIVYHDVYPNIDWVVYTDKKNLKYDFVVHPGGDPSQIKLSIQWAEEITIDPSGNLVITARLGEIMENKPVSYQGDKSVKSSFKLENNTISFNVENYDPELPLIIDPVVEWATYYGGSANDYAYSSVVDLNGNVYVAGGSNSTNNIADGGYQMSFGGGHSDAFLVKFNSAGTRLWATYYGGTESDYGRCSLDALGNVYLFGSTRSTTNISDGGHQNTLNGSLYDAFLVKFNSDGVRQWATYYGGDDEDRARACAVDASGNIYLSGRTLSTGDMADGGHQNIHGGGSSDGFLVKFNSDGVRQ